MQAAKTNIRYRQAGAPENPRARYPGFRPLERTFKEGEVVKAGGLALPCDMRMLQDVAITLRDGRKLFADVFLPSGDVRCPAIVGWSPYGKQGGIMILDDVPQRAGIPQFRLSGLEMFEGADPAYWCSHGYAVVNVDTAGAFSSDGDIHFWGEADARDGYDAIEWLAVQSWCTGRVGLAGNSWLAIAQWFIAATRPPHLAAIAPWEGWIDFFRNDVIRGGIPDVGFNEHMLALMSGRGRVEDIPEMVREHRLMDAYWQDKIAKVDQITTPAYVVSSWTNLVHGGGTIHGFRRAGTAEKWLRVHNSHEWTDFYDNAEDLRRFFDCFLKEVDNGWRATPRVRVAVLNPGGQDVVNRAEAEFPLARTQYRRLFLNSESGGLSFDAAEKSSSLVYQADDPDVAVHFTHRFAEDVELTGYFSLRLWVETVDADDLDIYCEVTKLDVAGERTVVRTVPATYLRDAELIERLYRDGKINSGMLFFSGAKGMLRASHRELDPALSLPAEPFHLHRQELKLRQGEIVPLDIAIWPLGMFWRKGEQLRVSIAGHKLSAGEMPGVKPPETVNRGKHRIHTGGTFDSHLLVPWISAI